MATEELEAGIKVRHKEKNKLGVIVSDSMGLCGPGFVMVEFDGSASVCSCRVLELEKLDKIQASLDPRKCGECIFANQSRCYRYSPARLGWMFSSKTARKIPTRIYPYCQNEVCH